jgi:hypothetical protein
MDDVKAEVKQKRVVGGRKLVMRDDETKLGDRDEWFIYRVEGWSKHGWQSLKVIRYAKGPKNLWQLGYKAGRMARNKDLKLLTEHHPVIANWVLTLMMDLEISEIYGSGKSEMGRYGEG